MQKAHTCTFKYLKHLFLSNKKGVVSARRSLNLLKAYRYTEKSILRAFTLSDVYNILYIYRIFMRYRNDYESGVEKG